MAISFFVKRHGVSGKKGCRVFYARRPEMETAEEKLAWLASARASRLDFDEVRADPSHNWLNVTSNDFDDLLELGSNEVRAGVSIAREKALFKSFALGINTARDEWLYGFNSEAVVSHAEHLIAVYNTHSSATSVFDESIKWSEALKLRLKSGKRAALDPSQIRRVEYRPFVPQSLFDSPLFIDRRSRVDEFFPVHCAPDNKVIATIGISTPKPFSVFAADAPVDLHVMGAGSGASYFALYRFSDGGTRHDNITDWALKQFQQHYHPGRGRKPAAITKEAIFHYVYAVLHDPVYRETYAQNLKREFPRIPLYGSTLVHLEQWAAWGAELMALHIGYETVEPWPLTRTDTPDTKACAAAQAPKCILKSEPESGRIVVDSETVLTGIPPAAWAYRLGNRSALDWVLDQHKERKPKDPTIREKFDTYRFADHKERVIDLLARVARVSVETVRIVGEIEKGPR